jgi:hypothetical protein
MIVQRLKTLILNGMKSLFVNEYFHVEMATNMTTSQKNMKKMMIKGKLIWITKILNRKKKMSDKMK